jgi:thiamine kinase-like enzyme
MDGRAWTREETLQPAAVDAIACLLRRVHALPIPTPTRALGPADWIALYSCALARRGVPVRERAALSGAVEEQLAVLRSAAPATPVMCHSDLHCQNLLVGTPASLAPAGAAVAVAVGGAAAVGGASVSGPLVLLDWEYAHVSDPLALLSSYLGRMPRAAETRRLRALAWLYDYVCLLWSELYVNLRDGAENGGVSQRAGEISHRLRQLR